MTPPPPRGPCTEPEPFRVLGLIQVSCTDWPLLEVVGCRATITVNARSSFPPIKSHKTHLTIYKGRNVDIKSLKSPTECDYPLPGQKNILLST